MSSAGVAVSPVRNGSALSPGYIQDRQLGESILIYVALSGSMIPMRVLESDSIESVKLRIQNCRGFVVKNQRLVCGGRELARSDSLVRDYGVADGTVLHLVLRLSDLQVISVKASCGKEFTFHVERCRDVGCVKRQIARKKKGLVDLDDQEIICNGELIEDQRLINYICKNNDSVIHLFVRKSSKVRAKPVKRKFELSIVAPQFNDKRDADVDRKNECRADAENNLLLVFFFFLVSNNLIVPRKPPDWDPCLELVIVNPKIEISIVLNDLINSTFQGLARGNYPIRTSEGTGGAYFMLNASGEKYISVFKPIDEEPMAVNNPRGLPMSVDGERLKKGIKVGQGALRDVAAYIMDHPKSGRRFISGKEGFCWGSSYNAGQVLAEWI